VTILLVGIGLGGYDAPGAEGRAPGAPTGTDAARRLRPNPPFLSGFIPSSSPGPWD